MFSSQSWQGPPYKKGGTKLFVSPITKPWALLWRRQPIKAQSCQLVLHSTQQTLEYASKTRHFSTRMLPWLAKQNCARSLLRSTVFRHALNVL